MICDLTNKKSAINFVASVLRKSITDIEESFVGSNDLDSALNALGIIHVDISLAELDFVTFHLTTSTSNCSEIRNKGLLSSRDIFLGKSELSDYLQKYGILISIENGEIFISEECTKMLVDKEMDKQVGSFLYIKFFTDNNPWGFISEKDSDSYSCLSCNSEIFTSVSRLIKQDIISEWRDICKRYKIIVKCGIDNFYHYDSVVKHGQINEDADLELLKIARNVINDNSIGYCQYYPGISVHEIIEL